MVIQSLELQGIVNKICAYKCDANYLQILGDESKTEQEMIDYLLPFTVGIEDNKKREFTPVGEPHISTFTTIHHLNL